MAVMQQKLYFGGIDSSAYGVYISGEGVFNAPSRVVNMVSVPGRNGAIAVDQGYWQNIEVVYPAFISATSLTALTSNLANFRNAIVSQVGYQQLNDTINSTEYRMAVYSEGLEFEPIGDSTTVQFELKFNCKPQRWLNSGNNTITGISSGSTITNPTKYDASPLLQITGYGNISFNGYSIALKNEVYGNLILVNSQRIDTSNGYNNTYTFDANLYNTSDYITVPEITLYSHVTGINGYHTIASSSASDSGVGTTTAYTPKGIKAQFKTVIPASTFIANANKSYNNICTYTITPTSGTNESFTALVQVIYTASARTLQIIVARSNVVQNYFNIYTDNMFIGDIIVNSSASVLGTPTYIDCDLGEAYKISNDETIGLNAYIDLGSNLPVLASGANTITYENTITDLKVVPRWWQL